MSDRITSHHELEVYKSAFAAAMEAFETSKRFPKEETYSLTDQIRRSSRSVCTNIAEAWRKRRYEAAFVSKLSDSDGEAAVGARSRPATQRPSRSNAPAESISLTPISR